MAATMTGSGELTYISFPIEKFETTEDGDLYVYGKATDGSVDSDEQIVDTDFSSKAIQEWLATGGNVRVQHNPQRDPAGVGVEATTGPDGETWVKSLVVEPTAKTLVEKGALRAYSVGIARPKIVRDSTARGGRIVDGIIVEISLVDRPANKNCGIQLVKSADDGSVEYTGKVFGSDEIITKAASTAVAEVPAAPVSVKAEIDLATGNSTFSPADLAKLLEHRRVAEKRQMDPSVGGGVDRDKISAADFAGRNRSFPIVTPADVSDAATSIGRAGESNFSSDKLKENIIRIARRKGPSFVAELPESWKKELAGKGASDGDDVTDDSDSTSGDDMGGDDVDDKGATKSSTDEAVIKGMKDCECGATYDADSKLRNCTECGVKLPTVTKSVSEADDTDLNEDDERDAEKATVTASAVKGMSCPKCDKSVGQGDRFCAGCGTKMSAKAAKKMGKKANVKKGTPTVGEGVVGVAAGDTEPVPAHREPDGADFEAFEHDADMPTVPDDTVEMKTVTRIKSAGAPYSMGAIHDILCSAYHPYDVAKCHPSARLSDIDVSYWQQKAMKDAATAPLEVAHHSTALWQHAETLKSADPALVEELRYSAFKSFSDAQIGPGTFPTPSELSPTSFRRPLITADHEAPSPGHAGPNTHPVPTEHIAANDFQRGPLTAGQAADSPANKNVVTAPLPVGEPNRVYYRAGMRDKARTAMAAMHDHIAQTFPDLCPMAAVGADGAAQSRPVPVPATKTAKPTDKKAAKAAKRTAAAALKALNEARAVLGLDEIAMDTINVSTKGATAGVFKDTGGDLRSDITALQALVGQLTKSLETQTSVTNKLQADVDALGDLPDPGVAAWKGAAQHNSTDSISKSAGLPVGAATVAHAAEQQRISMISALQSTIRSSADPGEREAAWKQLMKLTGTA